ncbi:hypothetical protein PENSPDRAFT_353836 [Peniophora sp. CONT]|nr:hypothetical protein PENSPDRAFT_353836 [Peniophora sp. CONT]
MAPSTRSKTSSLPSGARKRAAESDTKSQPDASSTSIQSRADTRKRAKVAHDEAEVQVSKRTARAPRPRVRGLLKALPDMPLDILEEIFMMCDLATLISVARTKKAFCRLLQSPGYAHVWREAFARDEDVPEAPEGWSHVKWAGLLYGGKICESCSFPTADTVSFGILKRLCEGCIRKDMIDCTSGTFANGLRLFPPDAVEEVMPTAFIRVAKVYTYGTAISHVVFAYETDLDDYLSNLRMVVPKPDHDGDLAFIAQEMTRFSSRREHALRAERWQKVKLDREAKELEDARRARKRELQNAKFGRHHEIMKRIRLAGYDTDTDADGVLKLKGVNVSQPLTDNDAITVGPTHSIYRKSAGPRSPRAAF